MTGDSDVPHLHNKQGLVLQRWSMFIIDELRKEIGRDTDLVRELGFEPANLFDQDGEPINAYVHVL